ncbi:c-type cytochrome, partial [Ralstonia pseudosolanacearum]|uniref:c-type cytochrome n=1 Tax=Ralstonia pseudosolanacearum TaxID=1310165 RepID=UPI003CF463DE
AQQQKLSRLAHFAGMAAGHHVLDIGKKVYDSTCQMCHAAGVAGAPKFGDKAAWAPRIAEGKAKMYDIALHGKGAMPPKGTYAGSDDDVKAAVDFMAAAAK